jgi:hypothetical protein
MATVGSEVLPGIGRFDCYACYGPLFSINQRMPKREAPAATGRSFPFVFLDKALDGRPVRNMKFGFVLSQLGILGLLGIAGLVCHGLHFLLQGFFAHGFVSFCCILEASLAYGGIARHKHGKC